MKKRIYTQETEAMKICWTLLKKFVKLLQVNLFLAGFSHFEPLCVGVGEKASKTVEETTSTSGTSGARYFFNSAGMLTVVT